MFISLINIYWVNYIPGTIPDAQNTTGNQTQTPALKKLVSYGAGGGGGGGTDGKQTKIIYEQNK